MIAYKFLAAGAIGPFSGFGWPTPAAGGPGAWVDAPGEASRGIHACRAADLPYWLDEELWVAELEGEVRALEHQVVAPRGRLLAPVEAWREVARDFAAECARALRARVEAALAGGGIAPGVAAQLRGYVADAEAGAERGDVAAAAFVAAKAAAVLAGDPRGFTAERQRQASWLAERVEPSGSSRSGRTSSP